MDPKIFVAYDFSANGNAVLEWTASLACTLHAPVRVIYVFPVTPSDVNSKSVLPAYPTSEAVVQSCEQLQKAVKAIGLDAETCVIVGVEIGETLVTDARNWGASLIAMGTHGRGGLKRAVLGSVADYVVRHAHCPVATFRQAAAQARTDDDKHRYQSGLPGGGKGRTDQVTASGSECPSHPS